ncbi:hypothetical protein GCM10009819_31800 [Agromyces tropicus]|uniref:(2Fe-2S)-binding protein n=1 Tax=Agromyces tropicus TaxID=555371 RepID=A0ABN2UT15_9MICO
MTAGMPRRRGVVPADSSTRIEIHLDGQPIGGTAGQTLAGVLIAAGRPSWRRSSGRDEPRGMFCGIGVCFDCIAEVNGERDVRLCRRRAVDGDRVVTQHDALPTPVRDEPGATDAGGADAAREETP